MVRKADVSGSARGADPITEDSTPFTCRCPGLQLGSVAERSPTVYFFLKLLMSTKICTAGVLNFLNWFVFTQTIWTAGQAALSHCNLT